jgi:hypothetical protein
MVSGSLSFPSRGAFHLSLTVLVHYRSSRVFSLGGWSPQVPTGFLVSRGTRDRTAGRLSTTPTGLSPSLARRSRLLRVELSSCNCRRGGPPRGRCGYQPRCCNPWPVSHSSRFGLFPVRSPLLRESRLMYFPPGTEMFQFPDWPLPAFRRRESPGMTQAGLPHSDTGGSTFASNSPPLFAANRVLLRPLTP